MPRYTFIDQHQSGIFQANECADRTVGTQKLGPCIAFFLYNPATKSCLAMHLDAMTSLNVIKTEIKKFLPDYADIQKCHAFLVGGWRSAIAEGDVKAIELPKFLKRLNVAKLEMQLLRFNAEPGDLSIANFYNTVVLNLDSGLLSAFATNMHSFVPVKTNTKQEQVLYDDSMEYMLHGGANELSDSVKRMLNGRSLDTLRLQVQDVYDTIIESNDGTPLIPSKNMLEIAAAQITNLAIQASRGNALEVLKLLYSNFVNPVSPVPGKLNNSPLHYGCDALNKNPSNYELKAIVLMLILHGKRDIKNDAGNLAISKLVSPDLKGFKDLCVKLMAHLNKYKDNPAVVGRIVCIYKIIMAVVVDDVLEYPGASADKKKELEQRLLDSCDMVTMATMPTTTARLAMDLRT